MRKEHKEIQKWIYDNYKVKYDVLAEIHKQNKLPDKKRHWYQPDVILKNTKGEIKYIIEVENDPVRKAIVGASILADASIKEINQKTRPTLIFIIYLPNGIRQIHNFEDKLKIVLPYCNNLKEINVYSEKDFKNKDLK
jgi:hypothetical protein